MIREYLLFYDLDYSSSVFTPEANMVEDTKSRDDLIEELSLCSQTAANALHSEKNQPLLLQIFDAFIDKEDHLPEEPIKEKPKPKSKKFKIITEGNSYDFDDANKDSDEEELTTTVQRKKLEPISGKKTLAPLGGVTSS
jgi:hypothetical protein